MIKPWTKQKQHELHVVEYHHPFMPCEYDHLGDVELARIVEKLEVASAALLSIASIEYAVVWTVVGALELHQDEKYRREGIPEWLRVKP